MQQIAAFHNSAAMRRTAPPASYNPYDDVPTLPRPRLADLDTSHHPLVAAAVDAARLWARRYNTWNREETRAPWLVLSGPNGTGKTHIARCIWSAFAYTINVTEGDPRDRGGRELVVERPTGRFWRADELMTDITELRDGAGVGSLIGAAPIVVLDDVGAEGTLQYIGKEQQEYERHVRYFRFIDFCYYQSNGIPGVLTTNLTLRDLADYIGKRAWDRLNEMAPLGQMVSLEGVPSWRVKAAGRSH